MIQTYKISVTTSGVNGSATGNTTSSPVVNGKLLAVYVDYTAQPSTTDVTIATLTAPVRTLLTLTNVNSDGWYYPRAAVHDTAGAALLYAAAGTAVSDTQPVDDHVKVTVAQGDDTKTVDVYLLVER